MERLLVLTGRGATGLLPVSLLSLSSRSLGLHAMGSFATALALALALAELADFFSERHVPRTALLDESVGEKTRRSGNFHGLRLLALLAGGAVCVIVLAGISEPGELSTNLVVLSSAASTLATKTQYATALAERRYLLVGIGPVLCLAVGTGSAILLLGSGLKNLWSVVVSLHVAKFAESAFLAVKLPLPRPNLDPASIRDEWHRTRYLFFQGLLSAAHARLIVPLVAAISGSVAAGLLSIGLSLLSIISLAAVAMAVPAYRHLLESGTFRGLSDVFRRTRRDWMWAVSVSVVLTASVAVVSRPLLTHLFHIDGREAQRAVMLVVLSGTFETLNLFAGAYYHACFRDRQLFALSIVTMSASWVLVSIGVLSGGAVGMGWGFVASRAVGALCLYGPVVLSTRMRASDEPQENRLFGTTKMTQRDR